MARSIPKIKLKSPGMNIYYIRFCDAEYFCKRKVVNQSKALNSKEECLYDLYSLP